MVSSERSEPDTEGDLLLVGEPLVVEDQHGMLLEGRAQPRERVVVQVLQVDVADLDPEQRMDRPELSAVAMAMSILLVRESSSNLDLPGIVVSDTSGG